MSDNKNLLLLEKKNGKFVSRCVEYADESGYFVTMVYDKTRLEILEYEKGDRAKAMGDCELMASTIKNVLDCIKSSLTGKGA